MKRTAKAITAVFMTASMIAVSALAPATTLAKAPETLFKDKVTLKVLEVYRPTFDTDNMIQAKINEYMNADVIYNQVPESTYKEAYGMILASKDLPDIVNFPGLTGANDWIQQGAVRPLDDLIEKFGQDAKSYWTETDIMQLKNVSDGKIYAIPGISDLKESFSISIRTDWLENVKMDIPTTLEEYRDVLVAFRDGDPNKNGKKDEIPYAGRLRAFENAFGIQSTGYAFAGGSPWIIDDGVYVTKYEHKNYIEYLEYVRDLYKEKLIDQEFYTRNKEQTQIDELFFANLAGTTEDYGATTRTITESVREKVPEATMAGILPLIGPYGDQQIMGRAKFLSAGCITSTTKQQDAAMQYLNWFFTEDGITLTNYGVEGETFDVVDGVKVLKEEYATFETSRKIGINKTVGPVIMTTEYYQLCQLGGKPLEEAGETFRLFYDALFMNTPYIYTPPIQFSTATGLEKGSELYTRLEDAETQCIIGSISIEKFEETLAAIKKDGLDKIAEEYNAILEK